MEEPTPAVRSMAIVQYYRDHRPWTCEIVLDPEWDQVVAAVEQMDDYCFPIVLLSCIRCESGEEAFADESAFNVIGGAGRYALFEMIPGWQYEDPDGSPAEVRLWASDQGYFCQERNIVRGSENALQIVRKYFETGSYDDLD